MLDEKQATLLLLKRVVRAQPEASSAEIADVLAQFSDAVAKELKPAVPELPPARRTPRKPR